MANRRMFSKRIGQSAKFLQMPSEAQLLYFHMVLIADDDGVVELYPLIRLLGTPPDVIKVLLAKKMIIQLNEDQVCVIVDWLEHNKIRSDRKVDSIYIDLIPSEIDTVKPTIRSDVKDNSRRIGGLTVDGLGKGRLGKDRLDNMCEISSKSMSFIKFSKKDLELANLLVYLISENNPHWKLKGSIDKWAEHIEKLHRIDERTYEQIEFMIRWVQKDDFWSRNILSTAKLRDKFNDLIPRLKKIRSGRSNTKVNR